MILKQFLRSQTAGLRSFGKKRTIKQLEDEAFRIPRACGHVSAPKAPCVLYGSNERDTSETLRKAIKDHVDSGHRKPDPDAQLMLCTIASFPVRSAVVEAHPALSVIYSLWRGMAISWCKKTYGSQLHKIIEHSDEEYQHLHVWAIAKTHGEQFNLGVINAGEYTRKGTAPEGRKQAYKHAWSLVQKDFWFNVSRWFGFARPAEKPTHHLPYKIAIVKRNKDALDALHPQNNNQMEEDHVQEDPDDTFEMLPARGVHLPHP